MKQAVLVRTDLKMPKGKLSAMVAHASVEAVLKSNKSIVDAWKKEGMKKIILKCPSESELFAFQKKAQAKKLVTALIKDAGRTFFKEPTITTLAIGPDEESKIDQITAKLKLIN